MLYNVTVLQETWQVWFAGGRPLNTYEQKVVNGMVKQLPFWTITGSMVAMFVILLTGLVMYSANYDHLRENITYVVVLWCWGILTVGYFGVFLRFYENIFKNRIKALDTASGIQSGEFDDKGWFSDQQVAFQFVAPLLTPAVLADSALAQRVSDYFITTRETGQAVDSMHRHVKWRLSPGCIGERFTYREFCEQVEALRSAACLLELILHNSEVIDDRYEAFLDGATAKLRENMHEQMQCEVPRYMAEVASDIEQQKAKIATAEQKLRDLTAQQAFYQTIQQEL